MTLKNSKPKPALARLEAAIVELAAAYPEVTEEIPWGHRAFKVRGKVFLFLGADAEGLSFSLKLPRSHKQALALPFTEPTHYGLGKSGWVTARVQSASTLRLSLLKEWLDESFNAVAPKKLAASLAGAAPAPAASKRRPAAARRKPSGR